MSYSETGINCSIFVNILDTIKYRPNAAGDLVKKSSEIITAGTIDMGVNFGIDEFLIIPTYDRNPGNN